MSDFKVLAEITVKQTDMMKHAWGYDSRSPGFRSHYCTDVDNKDMLNLVANGLSEGPHGVGAYGANCGMFHLTEKAITLLKDIKSNEKRVKDMLK